MRVVLSLMIAMFLFASVSSASPAEAQFKLGVGKYSINGYIKDDVAPYVKNGRMYLPMRYVAYAVGIGDNSIQWDAEKNTAYFAKPDPTGQLKIVAVTIGQNYIMVGNEKKSIDAPAELKNGRTMLPLRAVAEAFGCEVKWDPESKIATVVVPEE